MITREFVREYLNVKEMLERNEITAARYTSMILDLCDEYGVAPAKLAENNIVLEPKRFDIKKN